MAPTAALFASTERRHEGANEPLSEVEVSARRMLRRLHGLDEPITRDTVAWVVYVCSNWPAVDRTRTPLLDRLERQQWRSEREAEESGPVWASDIAA